LVAVASVYLLLVETKNASLQKVSRMSVPTCIKYENVIDDSLFAVALSTTKNYEELAKLSA